MLGNILLIFPKFLDIIPNGTFYNMRSLIMSCWLVQCYLCRSNASQSLIYNFVEYNMLHDCDSDLYCHFLLPTPAVKYFISFLLIFLITEVIEAHCKSFEE